MSRWLPVLALLFACPDGDPTDTDVPDPDGEVPATVGEGAREAEVLAPADYDGTTRLPVVFLLGGYWYYAWELDEWIGLSDRVDEDQFLLVLPDGTTDDTGAPFWNATETCCDYYGSGVDDHAYLQGLVDELTEEAAVDTDSIVFMGHSNGAFMSYSMACEADSPVDAVVSIAGSSYLDADNCKATHGVEVLQVHGQRDQVMPFEGDTGAPGALEVLERWSERNGCGAWQDDQGTLDLIGNSDTDTTLAGYADCAQRAELWSIERANHYPDFHTGFVGEVTAWLGWQ